MNNVTKVQTKLNTVNVKVKITSRTKEKKKLINGSPTIVIQ